MTTKEDQIILLNAIKHEVKNFHSTYNQFLEKWSNLYDQLNFDIFDPDEYHANPILPNLEYEYSKDFRLVKNNLRDLIVEFDHFPQTLNLSKSVKPATKAHQIALLKNLYQLLKNFLTAFHEFLEEWTNIYKDLTFQPWDSSLVKEHPVLERLRDYYDSYFQNKMMLNLESIMLDFHNSPILEDVK